MALLQKLLIQGIRSFDPEQREVIEFFSPLTVIVGHNGAGKTVREKAQGGLIEMKRRECSDGELYKIREICEMLKKERFLAAMSLQ